MGFQRIGVYTGEQASGGMAEAFVEVCVEVVSDEEVFVKEVGCLLVDDEFFVEAVAVRCTGHMPR